RRSAEVEISRPEGENQNRRSGPAFVANSSHQESPNNLFTLCFAVAETWRSRFRILDANLRWLGSKRVSHFRSLLFDARPLRRLHFAWRPVFEARPRVRRGPAHARKLAFVFQYGLL